MKNMSKALPSVTSKISVVILCGALLLDGCATNKMEPDYHSDAVTSTMRTRTEAGLEIAIDPFIESHRTQEFFGIDAAAEGIGIVYVRISNNTPDKIFLVEKDSFQLVRAGESAAQNASAKIERGTTGGEATAWLGASMSSLGGLAVMSIASGMIAHATEVRRNFIGKEMPDQTLAPGQNMEGFIYFTPVPKNEGWTRGAAIKAILTETKSHRSQVMTVPLAE